METEEIDPFKFNLFQPVGMIKNVSTLPLDKAKVHKLQQEVVGFIYYHIPVGVNWMGNSMQQWPIDLIYYQEIIRMLLPTDAITIIECGTAGGGVPFFLNDILTLIKLRGEIKKFKIITIDIIDNSKDFPEEIIFLHGDSTDNLIVDKVKAEVDIHDKVVVLLDSDHNKEHVFKEMCIYGKLVTSGSHMVVQDTALYINSIQDSGPFKAILNYLKDNDDFEIDHYFDRWIFTQHPFGYLKKKDD